MRVAGAMNRSLVAVTLAALAMLACAPARPAVVPGDAVYVPIGPDRDVVVWQSCAPGDEKSLRCTIWNRHGTVLESGRFLPLDLRAAPVGNQLQIETDVGLNPASQIQLRDGRVFVPEYRFDELKEFNDRLKKVKSAFQK
jgi:hypothetical protein